MSNPVFYGPMHLHLPYPAVGLTLSHAHLPHHRLFLYFSYYNQMTSRQSLQQKFKSISSRREYDDIKMSKQLNEILSFIDSTIKKQFQPFTILSFSICGGERKYKVDPQFESSFLALSTEERISYYETAINALSDASNPSPATGDVQEEFDIQTLPIRIIKGLKIGPSYRIKLNTFVVDCTHYEIELGKYLLRQSKKNAEVFILENLVKQDPITIRFQIQSYSEGKMKALMNRARKSFRTYIMSMTSMPQMPKNSRTKVLIPQNKPNNEELSHIQASSNSIDIQFQSQLAEEQDQRSVTQQVLNNQGGIQEEIYELIQRKEEEMRNSRIHKRWHKNVVKILLPHLSLVDIQNLNGYLPIVQDQSHRLYIYQHSTKKSQFIMQLYLKHNVEAVVKQLCQVQNYKLWNKSINESHVKLSISSDNAYLVYLKQRSLSQWFRQRDFLFLRHLCKVDSAFYFIDCSIENYHFIPFQSIIRGILNHCITKLQPISPNQCRLLLEVDVQYGGLLPAQSKKELTLTFLNQFLNLQSFISRFKGDFKNSYNLNWQICLTNEQSQPSQQSQDLSKLFDQPLETFLLPQNQDDQFYSIPDDQEREVVYQITKEELAQQRRKKAEISYTEEKIELNSEGLVRLPKNYLTVQHATLPVTIQPRRKKLPFDNLMLKNDFKVDKSGGLVLINAPKIAAQDNVIKFMMSTLKKNIFSGKGILNISLPVEIFNCDSNLQRLCESLSLAPDLIQRKSCKATPIERFKNCIAFAFTNSVLYFDIEKPFNPILGETFQGFIDGCPIYAEQISHHPPITSIYFVGRGYKIYGNLQAKVYVHLNSGEGVNEGFYTIQFNDGTKVVFQTCPGQLSGLAVGDRKFRFKGKTYIVDAKNRLFCAINFQDQSGLFSKNKWQYSDQLQGQIVRVTQSFIRSFFESKQGKDAIVPGKKDIQQRFGKVSGRWIQAMLIDDVQYYNVRSFPYEMIHYEYPLNSNSNYREDLLYRKLNDLARSQSQKQRLEVIQRNDRKLREKYSKKSH